ncbi:hypothetical protein [Curtobacterium sp. MCSS17_007]|uniref:hypothetical protein n=1 Tax=Curtobacterium sp. MCSS17_007 TaxID=2175646 RepID=UPI0011B6CF72|nr:hypothetical protein [Curtobacterium sp. MCSS17_007]WIE74496.1 hypothetical protein DEJ22_009395 [Curtobacterium sp. MCSS17_007]
MQTKAIQIYVEGHGKVSVSESMRRAGYSDATAKNPSNLTRTMEWKEAMEAFLPDIDLLAKHHELLNAQKLESAKFPIWVPQERIREILLEAGCSPRNSETNPMTGVTVVWYYAPNHDAQAKALLLAYKLKGKLTEKVEHSVNPDGLYGNNELTITVVENSHDAEHPTGA